MTLVNLLITGMIVQTGTGCLIVVSSVWISTIDVEVVDLGIDLQVDCGVVDCLSWLSCLRHWPFLDASVLLDLLSYSPIGLLISML
jgi:hypothetical protein